MTTASPADQAVAPLVARTVEVDLGPADRPLTELLPADSPVAWLRHGDGLVGWGVAASVRTSGAERFAEADAWWRRTTGHAVVRDDVRGPGTGLVAFGTFGFADAPGESVLVVPEVVVGRRGDRAWLTRVTRGGLDHPTPSLRAADPPEAPTGVTYADGSLDGAQWMTVVADAVRRISAGDLEKVVLARDLVARADRPVDVRWPVARLAEQYPMCWTFHVDGIFGATPEMLVRRERGLVTSRVLAGTIQRTGDDEHDLTLAATLARSSKDLEEHEYAVRSVADALAPHCSSMNVPESPFVLHLPNVMHLATDVAGVVHDAGHRVVAPAGRGPAPLGRRRRHPHRHLAGADRRDRAPAPRPLGRAGGLDGRRRRRRVGASRSAPPSSRATPSACSRAAASSPTPSPPPSSPRPRRSSSPSATRWGAEQSGPAWPSE